MINQANPYKRYQQTRVETAGPLQLVIMLYDGAIRFVHQAQQAILDKKPMLANEYLQRAQDIVNELMITLNPEAGEIAANLRSLYEFMIYRLVQANLRKDPEMLEDVAGLLSTLRSAWAELQIPAKEAVGK